MESLFLNLSEVHRILAYVAIFIGMFIEGEIILVLTGVLVRSGVVGFFPSLITAFIGIVLSDLFYWSLGKRLIESGRKKFLFFTTENTAPILRKLEKRSGFWIFISKFAWNLNRVVLVCAGYSKISLKKLLKYSATAAAVWTTLLISLGYIFAHQTDILKHDLKRAALFLTLLIIGVIFFEYALKKVFNALSNGSIGNTTKTQ